MKSLLFISSLLNAFAMFWLFYLAEIYQVDSAIHRLNRRGQEFVVYDRHSGKGMTKQNRCHFKLRTAANQIFYL